MLPEHTLNLSRLDPVAAYFELLIVASEIIEISVGAETSQISALVHARTRRTAKRIRQEPLGRQGRTIVVAARDTVPGDKELADHAFGWTILVEDPGLRRIPAPVQDWLGHESFAAKY